MSTLLDIDDLRVTFATRRGIVRAVDGVSYTLDEGETLGIVGESGSGKSVTHLALLGLLPNEARVEARRVHWRGRDLFALDRRERASLAGREIAMIFQDPMSALNPLMTVGRQLEEVLEIHENATRKSARKRALDALIEVGIADPRARLDAFPHELSGGMRQRVMIAMALLCRPRLLIADEPTTALDVTIQAQILELLKDLQRRHGTAIVLVTHSLGVVAGLCDRVLVMYAGRVVEEAHTPELFARPLHPYTRGLLAGVPRLDSDPKLRLAAIPGSPPDLATVGASCPFAPRCEMAEQRCRTERPNLDRASPESPRRSACFLARGLMSPPVRT